MEPVAEPEKEGNLAKTPILAKTLSEDSDSELEGDTIVVDTGITEPTTDLISAKGTITRSKARAEALQANAIEPVQLPRTYAQAMSDTVNSRHWQQAISEELTKLQALDTWKYAVLPAGKDAIGYTWVFTVKYTTTGLIDCYKARLVAQGFKQIPGDDYLETFSPTIRSESLRILLAISAYEDLEVRQIDIVSAYPRSKLHATIYMKPPAALEAPEGVVLQLQKSLYGLKQSGREWYIEACRGLNTLGFTPIFSEPSVFRNATSGIIIGLYVDDMLICGPKLQAVEAVIQGIAALWEIKDLGDVSLILGVQVRRNRQTRSLTLSQEAYITELLQRYKLQEATTVTTPVADRNTLIKGSSDEQLGDQALYQSAIGALMWLVKGTRPDIAYSVGQLSQHCNNPSVRHWNAVTRVFRYLKGTRNYALQYNSRKLVATKLQGYCDADYAGDIIDRHSVSGQLWCLVGGPITWNSTKQRSVALSTTESEYIALAEASKQGQWIRALLKELQRLQYLSDTLGTPIFSDNQACIALAKDPVAHSRTKHIDVRYHYIRQLVTFNKATVSYLSTVDMIADILTKPLAVTAFKRCSQAILVEIVGQ
jgi:hypothetical protein